MRRTVATAVDAASEHFYETVSHHKNNVPAERNQEQ